MTLRSPPTAGQRPQHHRLYNPSSAAVGGGGTPSPEPSPESTPPSLPSPPSATHHTPSDNPPSPGGHPPPPAVWATGCGPRHSQTDRYCQNPGPTAAGPGRAERPTEVTEGQRRSPEVAGGQGRLGEVDRGQQSGDRSLEVRRGLQR